MNTRYRFTLFGLLFFVATVPTVIIFDLDIVEQIQRFEEYEIDELIAPTIILVACFVTDRALIQERKKRSEEVDLLRNEIHNSTQCLRDLRKKLTRLRNAIVDQSAPETISSTCDECIAKCRERIVAVDTSDLEANTSPSDKELV